MYDLAHCSLKCSHTRGRAATSASGVHASSPSGALIPEPFAGAPQVQEGFPTDRVLTRRGNLAFLFDATTRLLKLNTNDAYPVVLAGGNNRTLTFYFPYALPNVAVGDAVVVRRSP